MDHGAKPDLSAEIEAALAWWREAGVETDFHDAPVSWLAKVEATDPQPRPREGGDLRRPDGSSETERGPRLRKDGMAQMPAETIDRSAWPQDLAAFAPWWLTEPSLDAGRVSGRVPPRGIGGAELMILVPEPERDDADRLLSGAQGELLGAMLTAMTIAPESAYFASAIPRHTPMADWTELARQGIGEVLRHHVALVQPRRLLVLGANILPLLGHDPTHNRPDSRDFNHDGVTIPLFAGKSLAALIERPRWKAGFWQGWLDWTASGAPAWDDGKQTT